MALGGIYETGTVTIAVGGVSVTGVGTLWSPIVEVGDWLFIGGQVGLIGAVVDDTHLTLETAWQGTLPSAAVYVIVKMSWLRYDPALTQAKLRELLEHLQAEGHFLFVEGDAPDPAAGEDGQWALKTDISPWGLWYKDDGVWLTQAPPAGIKWRGAWSSAINYGPGEGVEHLGSSYISRTSHINQPPASNPDDWDLAAAKGNTGSTGPTGPPGMVWRGVWSSATAYVVNDAVGHLGASYIAILAHTNQEPPNATYWNLLAQQGTAVIVDDSITPPMLDADTAVKQEAFRVRLAAAPFDAMAYSGMQVNGSMEVWQEGIGTGTNSAYTCDGWKLSKAGTMVVLAQPVASYGFFPGFDKLLVINVSTAEASLVSNDGIAIFQPIEGYRTARLGWGTANNVSLTIGFWVCHVAVGIYSVGVQNSAQNRSYVTTYTQNVASAKEYKTITIPPCPDGSWNTTNGVGMYLFFTMAKTGISTTATLNQWITANVYAATTQVNGVAATGDNFRIGGVVVLPGTQAPTAAQSPLIMRPYDQELLTCQRYYWRDAAPGWLHGEGVSIGSGNNVITVPVFFKSVMRAVPTITLPTFAVNGVGTPVVGTVSGGPTTSGCEVNALSNSAINTRMYFFPNGGAFSADARL